MGKLETVDCMWNTDCADCCLNSTAERLVTEKGQILHMLGETSGADGHSLQHGGGLTLSAALYQFNRMN